MTANSLSRFVLLLGFILCLTISLVLLLRADAQQPCPDVPPLDYPRWRPGTTVTVYFDERYQWSVNVVNAI